MKQNNNVQMMEQIDLDLAFSDPVVDPRCGKPHTRLLKFQNHYKDVLQSAPSNNHRDMNNDHYNEQQNVKLMKKAK